MLKPDIQIYMNFVQVMFHLLSDLELDISVVIYCNI